MQKTTEQEKKTGLSRFGSDLDELRKRVVVTAVVFLALLIAGFPLASHVIDFILESAVAGQLKLNAFSPWDAMAVYMQFATIFALVVSFPVILWQVWAFVAPALTKKERRAALMYIPFTIACFLLGFAFAYFVVFPSAFYFTTKITDVLGVEQTYGVGEFFSYMGTIVLFVSCIFLLPPVTMFLTSLGLVKPAWLKKVRKYAYVILAVVAAAITPPDFVSQLLVLGPLVVLYEGSISLSVLVERKRLKSSQ